MTINELQRQTNINIQEKANLIWEIATHLVGLFKPHEYGKVILPMTVLKRFDDALASINVASIAIRFNASQAVIRNVMNMVCKGVAYAVKKWIKSNL